MGIIEVEELDKFPALRELIQDPHPFRYASVSEDLARTGYKYVRPKRRAKPQTETIRAIAKAERDFLRLNALKHYSPGRIPRCACEGCPEHDNPHLVFLDLDHISGGGSKHRKSLKTNIFAWLCENEYPPGYQVLCANCNKAKGSGKRCPVH